MHYDLMARALQGMMAPRAYIKEDTLSKSKDKRDKNVKKPKNKKKKGK